MSRKGFDVLRDAPRITFRDNWGSAHAPGAQFLFADGSVHLIRHGTDPTINPRTHDARWR